MRRAAIFSVPALVLALAAVTAAEGGNGVRRIFFAPGVTTSCELDAFVPKVGTAAYCQTYPHAESVIMSPTGKLSICHGLKCIGRPPDQMPTLVYGSSISVGPFRCTSLRTGVKCVVQKTGHGFLISPTAITRV